MSIKALHWTAIALCFTAASDLYRYASININNENKSAGVSMKKCPYCSEEIREEAIKCKHCGEFLVDSKRCDSCNAAIPRSAEFCTVCGVMQSGTATPNVSKPINQKNKTVAALLAIFLGGLGIHKFYLQKTGVGLIYLLFCWTFIPAIIGFIEGIILLVMDENSFMQKYGKGKVSPRVGSKNYSPPPPGTPWWNKYRNLRKWQ